MKLGIPDIPGLRRDLLAVAVLATSGSLAMGALGPILPMYLDSIGIDAWSIGLLFSVSSVAVAIGEFSWGWALDRVHFRLPMAVGTLGTALVLLAFAFTQSLPVLFLLFFLRGSTTSATFPVSRAFVGTTMGAHQKALFFGLFATVLGAGRTLGAFGGGNVAEQWGYLAVFVVCAIIVMSGGVVGLPLLQAKRLTQYAERSAALPIEAVNPLRPNPIEAASFKAQGLIAILTFVPMGVTMTFVPLLAKKVILLQPSDVGLIYSIAGLANVALTVPMGHLSDRYGRRLFMAVGLAAVAASATGTAYASSFYTLLAFTTLGAIGMSTFSPAAVALLSDTAPADRQGTAMGLYGLCEDIGIIVGPAVGGLLWESLGPQPTFWFGAAPTLIAAFVSLVAIRRQPLLEASTVQPQP